MIGRVRAWLDRRTSLPLGAKGERLAARWLKRHGYEVLERNIRLGRDEADLVARAPDGRTLVIVEVKTRRDPVPVPEASLTRDKRRHLTRLAHRVQRRSGPDQPIRFDVITIVWPTDGEPDVRHYPNAFTAVGQGV